MKDNKPNSTDLLLGEILVCHEICDTVKIPRLASDGRERPLKSRVAQLAALLQQAQRKEK